MKRRVFAAAALLLTLQASHAQSQASAPLSSFTVTGDAIEQPLTATPGDPARGRAIVANRQVGLCLLCHTGPFPEERFQGNLAPDLAGAGARWTPGQLRLRIADPLRINPESIMPAYLRTEHLARVGPAWRGKTLLTPQQIEDVVAWLQTLRN
jgi:L-cysteine S-thiosulfotransferase